MEIQIPSFQNCYQMLGALSSLLAGFARFVTYWLLARLYLLTTRNNASHENSLKDKMWRL